MTDGMASRPRNGLSLCSGGAGLDMGLMLAEPGFHTRCFVEWEEYPRSVLIAAQRAGYLAPAPIWDDLTTFDARPLAGAIDTLLAGYPCQPFSMAGQRKGADDPRHLWPHVARVARELRPALEWIFLENVAGHVSLGAETVLRELWDMGFTPAAGIFSAEEVGAPHERQRWFCVAHRDRSDGDRGRIGRMGRRVESTNGSGSLADPDGGHPGAERQQRGGQLGFQPEGGRTGRGAVEDARCSERRSRDAGRHDADRSEAGRDQGSGWIGEPSEAMDHPSSPRCDPARIRTDTDSEGRKCLSGDGCAEVEHTQSLGRGEGRAEPVFRIGRDAVARTSGEVADASGAGPQGRERPGSSDQRHRATAHGPTAQRGCTWLFPPGPGDRDAWGQIIASHPDLAPALSVRDVKRACDNLAAMVEQGRLEESAAQSVICGSLAGMAQRSRSLRLLGNGVVPVCAAYAWRSLSSEHGGFEI